jgi:leucyl-tRNA synthetase
MKHTESRRRYDFKSIEEKWQERWETSGLFQSPDVPRPEAKFYMLVMFAYPSGDIHMGHFRNYIIGDAVARQQMMLGKDVLHPFGWDAFGLPAERAAIQRGIHPREWTLGNIEVSRKTLKRAGISFDWSREVNSCLPDYYKWTQWMFLRLFEKGLAYRKRGFVNWCPEDKTVLANEQVKEGRCERCDTVIEKRDQVQWYFRITDYADRLLEGLDRLPGWPDNLKTMQREWIGRSQGVEVDFIVEETGEKLPIFTTRPDTIYGVTFMALSPEAEIVDRLNLESPYREQVAEYRKKAFARSEIERTAGGDKDGVFTGKYAVNPFNNKRIPLWVADYVLGGYGTGAVMAVPGHDSRDFAFARKYGLPIRIVIQPDAVTALDPDDMDDAFTDLGIMVRSGSFDGKIGEDGIEAVCAWAEEKGIGRRRVNYKLKDWLISRQRYWGAPIPIIHCPKCGPVAVPDADLPVLLPDVENFMPAGRSPLEDVPEFMDVSCPACGGAARRDADTMDTFVCSSWYFLRYCDAHNTDAPYDTAKADAWMPIDLYIGGITHATGHLLYFRFFTKFLHDIDRLACNEPDLRMFNHGMVLDAKGEVMSKSKGNVVSPTDLMDERGVDVARLAMFFTAPSEKEVLWSEEGTTGVEKFVMNKFLPLIRSLRGTRPDVTRTFVPEDLTPEERAAYVRLNQTVKKAGESFAALHFNTAIAAVMELVRDFDPSKIANDVLNDQIILKTVQLLAPLAPHLAEEMWEQAGFTESVFKSAWPVHDPRAVVGDRIAVPIQVNGKLRDTIEVASGASQTEIEEAALASPRVRQHTDNREIVKKIYIPGRLLNIVVKG